MLLNMLKDKEEEKKICCTNYNNNNVYFKVLKLSGVCLVIFGSLSLFVKMVVHWLFLLLSIVSVHISTVVSYFF
jgi:hypothetical protein